MMNREKNSPNKWQFHDFNILGYTSLHALCHQTRTWQYRCCVIRNGKGEGGIICWHRYQKWKNCSCYTFFWNNYPSIRFFDDRDNRTEQLHDLCNRTRHAEIAPSLNDFIENLLTSILSPILKASAILRMALQCPF